MKLNRKITYPISIGIMASQLALPTIANAKGPIEWLKEKIAPGSEQEQVSKQEQVVYDSTNDQYPTVKPDTVGFGAEQEAIRAEQVAKKEAEAKQAKAKVKRAKLPPSKEPEVPKTPKQDYLLSDLPWLQCIPNGNWLITDVHRASTLEGLMELTKHPIFRGSKTEKTKGKGSVSYDVSQNPNKSLENLASYKNQKMLADKLKRDIKDGKYRVVYTTGCQNQLYEILSNPSLSKKEKQKLTDSLREGLYFVIPTVINSTSKTKDGVLPIYWSRQPMRNTQSTITMGLDVASRMYREGKKPTEAMKEVEAKSKKSMDDIFEQYRNKNIPHPEDIVLQYGERGRKKGKCSSYLVPFLVTLGAGVVYVAWSKWPEDTNIQGRSVPTINK